MHRIAEYGIAAHWKYKEGISKDKEEVKLAWLRQALEWQKETNDPREFMESLRVDLFSSQVFVFTPAGDVIELPAGSTPLDFAFKIHTDVGAKCIGAKINGRMVPIDHVLKNGDIIEIMTSPNASGPSIDWLKIVKSSTARTKIRQWLKKETKSDDIERGRQLLDKYLRRKGYEPKDILKNAYLQRVIKEMNFNNYDEMYNQIANGGSLVGKAGSRLISYYEEENAEEKKKEENTMDAIKVSETPKKVPKHKDSSGIIVKGMDNLMIRVAKCCNPVPGDREEHVR
jgi:GTP pyrophosphokinase